METPATEPPPSKGRQNSELFRLVLSIERKIITPEAAALLLFASFIFGAVSAGYVFIQEQPEIEFPEARIGSIAGYVYTEDGEPLAGASVTISEIDEGIETNENGYFYIPEMPPGEYDLSASAVGHTAAIYRITVDGLQPKMYQFSLSPGSSTEYKDFTDPAQPPSFFSMRIFIGSLFLFGSLCSLLGAVFAFKRKGFKRTLALAVFGVLSYGFLVGSVLAAVAAGFIMAEKHVYGKGKKVSKSGDLVCDLCKVHVFPIEPYVECRCGRVYHLDCVQGGSCVECGQEFTNPAE